MKYFVRDIENELISWKNDESRKPLLLRGARQVGKSSVIKHFSQQFENYIEVNFDMDFQVSKIFEKDLNPIRICEELSVVYGSPITTGKTLVFFDEIQACPNALSSLRYFYEKLPNLHLVAAGSLLEFAIENIHSYGVGRIRSLFMYPFSFGEFLSATDNDLLRKAIQKATPQNPLSEILHAKAIDSLKRFLIIGGMPQVVATYCETHDLLRCQKIIDDVLLSLEDDFSKYKKRISTYIISEVFKLVAYQTGAKFRYSKAIPELNNLQVKEGLRLLQMAGLIYPVVHTSANGVPLGGQINPKFSKYIVCDTGMYQRMQKLQISEILLDDSIKQINNGSIAEQFVGLEIIKNSSCYEMQSLFYWHRDSKNSQAEVDYVVQKDAQIVPIEVKSGVQGSMQSLYLFMKEKNIETGIRTSLENFSYYNSISVYPLYGIGNILHTIPSDTV